MHTGFRLGKLSEGEDFEDSGLDGRIILKWILKKWDGAWSGLDWLRIETHDEPL
jgi:hypothetical protein